MSLTKTLSLKRTEAWGSEFKERRNQKADIIDNSLENTDYKRKKRDGVKTSGGSLANTTQWLSIEP